MKLAANIAPKEYICRLRERFDSPFMFGAQRFTGWCIGRVFSVKYSSGKEFGRRFYPVANKAMGFIRSKDGKAVVCYYNFRGFTDPVSLILLFGLCALIFRIVGVPLPAVFALGWTVAVALPTWACSAFSSTGQEGKAKLDHLLADSISNMRDA